MLLFADGSFSYKRNNAFHGHVASSYLLEVLLCFRVAVHGGFEL